MSTQFTNRQWRLPNEENKSKVSNYSMGFDGSNQYIDLGSSIDLGLNNTVSMWLNLDSGYNGILLGEDSYSFDYFLYSYSTGFLVRISSTALNYPDVPTYLTSGSWHHLAVVRSGDSIEVFVDGTSRGTNTGFGTTTNTKFDTIAAKPNGTLLLEGLIDGMSAFNYALSSSQITTLYGSSSTGIGNPMSLSPKPVAFYQLGDKSAFNGANYLVPNIAAEEDDGDIAASFSPFALDFDGTNDYIDTGAASFSGLTEMSVSAWVKPTATGTGAAEAILSTEAASPNRGFYLSLFISSEYRWQVSTDGSNKDSLDAGVIVLNEWTHIVATWNQSTMNLYINGVLADTMSTVNATGTFSTTNNMFIGQRTSGAGYFSGDVSNVSIWNAALTSSQVSEIYNEGVPSNLNNHSAYSNLVSWWQLGSNSSFNTNWTVLDEKGSNNGTSQNMDEVDIVDGVGSYANGLSSGMGGDEVIGDAPYSSSNSLSVNMDVLDRVEDTPS